MTQVKHEPTEAETAEGATRALWEEAWGADRGGRLPEEPPPAGWALALAEVIELGAEAPGACPGCGAFARSWRRARVTRYAPLRLAGAPGAFRPPAAPRGSSGEREDETPVPVHPTAAAQARGTFTRYARSLLCTDCAALAVNSWMETGVGAYLLVKQRALVRAGDTRPVHVGLFLAAPPEGENAEGEPQRHVVAGVGAVTDATGLARLLAAAWRAEERLRRLRAVAVDPRDPLLMGGA